MDRLRGIKGIALIELERADIVRHRLVQNIVDAYEPDDKPFDRRRTGRADNRIDARSDTRSDRPSERDDRGVQRSEVGPGVPGVRRWRPARVARIESVKSEERRVSRESVRIQ